MTAHVAQDAPHLVDDQSGQGLAFDILGDDHQGLIGLADSFQQRHQRFGIRDLFLEDQDQGVFQFDRLLILIRDEMGREKAAVELHAFHHFDRGFRLPAFLDRDHAVFADLQERIGQHAAD